MLHTISNGTFVVFFVIWSPTIFYRFYKPCTWTCRIYKNISGPKFIGVIFDDIFSSLLMFFLTLFQIATYSSFYFWAPAIIIVPRARTFRLCKNIRGPKHIGVINRLHPQKQPFLRIHTNPGTAWNTSVMNLDLQKAENLNFYWYDEVIHLFSL